MGIGLQESWMTAMLTLSEALKQNRLREFIRQTEERLAEIGAEHPDAAKMDAARRSAIRTQRSRVRTAG